MAVAGVEPGGVTPAPDPRPACVDCQLSGGIAKEWAKYRVDFCMEIGGYTKYTGMCERYQCTNGYYYSFSGWTPGPCIDHTIPVSNPVCPLSSCLPP